MLLHLELSKGVLMAIQRTDLYLAPTNDNDEESAGREIIDYIKNLQQNVYVVVRFACKRRASFFVGRVVNINAGTENIAVQYLKRSEEGFVAPNEDDVFSRQDSARVLQIQLMLGREGAYC